MKIDCLLCNTSGESQLISPSIRDDASGQFKIHRCLTCGHVQLFPLPTPEQDQAFYDGDRQLQNVSGGGTDLQREKFKSIADTERRVSWLDSIISSPSKILDVGCGYGFFVDALTNKGYEAMGIEVSKLRLDLAKSSLQGDFIQGQIDDQKIQNLYQNNFDAVTLFHVLEHLTDPVNFLLKCLNLIKPNGYLLIEVPNFRDELIGQSLEYAHFYWQRAHLSYFSPFHLELTFHKAEIGNFVIDGVQRYGLRNLLHWLDEKKPQLTNPSFDEKTLPNLENLEQLYKGDRQSKLTCDTLIATIKKCN
jgi:2-polyprenyl-3-methyl-5-hydroxy-6-metoxy-1,4-benzoquinol methylase